MTSKDCCHRHDEGIDRTRLIIYGIVAFVVLVLFAIFLVWAILRPARPQFILREATVSAFNFTASPPFTLSVIMQITIASKNSMNRVGIYYQKLDAYATYRSQQITPETELPSTYQSGHEITIWSPFLNGCAVPIYPGLMMALQQDENVGAVLLNVKIVGSLRWKVGTWFSGTYSLNVNCPAYIKFCNNNGDGGSPYGPVMKFQAGQSCSVEV